MPKAWFLDPSSSDILGWINPLLLEGVGGVLCVHCRVFSSIPGLLGPDSTPVPQLWQLKMSPVFDRCPLGSKITLWLINTGLRGGVSWFSYLTHYLKSEILSYSGLSFTIGVFYSFILAWSLVDTGALKWYEESLGFFSPLACLLWIGSLGPLFAWCRVEKTLVSGWWWNCSSLCVLSPWAPVECCGLLSLWSNTCTVFKVTRAD